MTKRPFGAGNVCRRDILLILGCLEDMQLSNKATFVFWLLVEMSRSVQKYFLVLYGAYETSRALASSLYNSTIARNLAPVLSLSGPVTMTFKLRFELISVQGHSIL